MTLIVVDASVAFKWVVEEEGSDAAADLARHELWAPDLLRAECANALWAKARRGELDDAEVVERNDALATVPMTLVGQQDLLADAVLLALELGHPVYDCLYLALAVQRDTYVVTADRRLLDVVRRSAYRERIRPLGESPP
jgi:predicted nucleic acid-binding protein